MSAFDGVPQHVAELEAFTDIHADPRQTSIESREYGRRFRLVPGVAMQLGRDERKMDVAVPEDEQLSRFQATLTWDPAVGTLTVQTRPASPPAYPFPPGNQTLVLDDSQKKLVPVSSGTCVVVPGMSFWIGQTRFTLHTGVEPEPESESEALEGPAGTHGSEERTREELEDIPFADPATALHAMEQLPATIRAAYSEQGLFRQMLKVVMDAMPRADAAAFVRVPPDNPTGETRLTLVESALRPAAYSGANEFKPSRRLAHRAIIERRRSCLHFWAPEVAGSVDPELTMIGNPSLGRTPWAVCTPFQDGSRYALYVAGQTVGQWNLIGAAAPDKLVTDLTEYQKLAELFVGLIETTLHVSRLTQQNKVIRRAWPQSLWRFLDDSDELERMLAPKEHEVTTLFCDLRNYSVFTSTHASDLLGAQREVSNALSVMSGAITDRDGVVGGFRGDAVLGFWGWPKAIDRQVEMAARAAIAIQGRLNSWSQGGKCGVGLTHGVAVAGRLGAHDLAVVDIYGPVVNLTFRLEAMTKAFGVPIIVSQEVADCIAALDPERGEMQTRPLGRVRAKGFPEPLWAHELCSSHTPSVQEWKRANWDDAVKAFTDGQWESAYEALATQFSEDPAARCLMRVMDATTRTPPADWDGSFVPSAFES